MRTTINLSAIEIQETFKCIRCRSTELKLTLSNGPMNQIRYINHEMMFQKTIVENTYTFISI